MDLRDELVLKIIEESAQILEQEKKDKQKKNKGEDKKMDTTKMESLLKEIKGSLQAPRKAEVEQSIAQRKADIKLGVLSAAIKGEPQESFSIDDMYILGITDNDVNTFVGHDMLKEIVMLEGGSLLQEIATVETMNRLEIPIMKYSEQDGTVSFTGDLYEFDTTINTTLSTQISETILLGNGDVLTKAEMALENVLWDKAEKSIFNSSSDLFNQNIQSVDGEPFHLTLIKAIKMLPKASRKNATIVMNFDDYTDLVMGAADTNIFENGKFLGKEIKVIDECQKPIVGDFKHLVINFAFLKIQNKKQVKKGIYDIVLRCALDHKVTLKDAFVVVDR